MAKRIRHWHTKVVGVTHRNDDGTDRQEILRRCSTGEGLVLEHQEDNPVDSKAVAAKRINGEQLGFLPQELAHEIVSKAGRGYEFAATVTDLTGGKGSKLTRGANVCIFQYEDGVTQDELNQYAQDHAAHILGDNSSAPPNRPQPEEKPLQITGGAAVAVVLGLIFVVWLVFG